MNSAHRPRRSPRPFRPQTGWLALAVCVFVGAIAISGSIATTRTQTQLTQTAQQATDLAGQIQRECGLGTLHGAICMQAAAVQATPIPGPAGIPGINGVDGAPGKDGAPGPAGEVGKPGDQGKPGINGSDGKPGTNGINGSDGKPGADGKPGPTCPPGSSQQNVLYGDGRSGVGCVLDTQPTATPAPPTSTVVPTPTPSPPPAAPGP